MEVNLKIEDIEREKEMGTQKGLSTDHTDHGKSKI